MSEWRSTEEGKHFPIPQGEFARRMRAPSGERARERFRKLKASQNPMAWQEMAGYPNPDTYHMFLVLDNDQRSYRWLKAWKEAWDKKIKSGRFDIEEAEFAVWKYIVPAAQGRGRAREWKAGKTYDPDTGRFYMEDEFVGDDRIDPKEISYSFAVSRILEMEE